MRSLSQALPLSSRAALAAALLLAPLRAGQDVPALQGPEAAQALAASGEQERQETAPRPIPGEILPPESHGPSFIESMAEVMERQRALPEVPFFIHKERNGAHGTWEVPSRSGTFSPHSGEHYATNKWGDTSMGISFGAEVALEGAWIAAQGLEGAWSTGVRVVGFRDGVEVGRTAWFETIDREPRWFAVGLRGIDRAVFESRAVVDGAGFYGLDDLTFVRKEAGEDARVVLDFDDLPWRASLTGSGYGGLTWETGTGDFAQEVREVHEPKTPPGKKDEVLHERSKDDPG